MASPPARRLLQSRSPAAKGVLPGAAIGRLLPVTVRHICHMFVLASFPGPSFSFKSDGEKQGLVHTVCACAELRATRGEKGVCDYGCDLPVFQRVEHSIAS